MSGMAIGLSIFGGLLALLALRIHVGVGMLIGGAAGFLAMNDGDPSALLFTFNHLAYARLSNYDLAVIPLFMLMGQFATHGGLSRALFKCGLRRFALPPGEDAADLEPWRPERVCYYFINDDAPVSFGLDVSEVYAKKRQALACHVTQFAPPGAQVAIWMLFRWSTPPLMSDWLVVPDRSRLIVVAGLSNAARNWNGNSAELNGSSARFETASSISTGFMGATIRGRTAPHQHSSVPSAACPAIW